LPKGGQPLAVLKITLAADVIDVNVHPQKKEVKFSDEQKIFQAVYNAVLCSLNKNNLREQEKKTIKYDTRRPQFETGFRMQYETPLEKPPALKIQPFSQQLKGQRQAEHVPALKPNFITETNFEPDLRHSGERSEEPIPSLTEVIISRTEKEELKEKPHPEKIDLFATISPSQTVGNEFYGLYPLGQVEACYIAAYKKDGGGLFIIDQHAAHERILYEKLKKNLGQVPSQQLLLPALFDFTASDLETLEEHKDLFYQLGFGFELAGPLVLRLLEIPADIAAENAEAIIRHSLTMLNDLKEPTAHSIRHAYLQIASCRSAIKAGDILTMREMQSLLEELGLVANAYTCPHGRPAVVNFSQAELEKMFKRS
jgi:DNA mismatch repair protein MutL